MPFVGAVLLDTVSETSELSDERAGDETDALLSRLRVIEDQPLETRAASFAQINDELQARLEIGDTPHPNA